MADKTNIEWTDATWNPVTGCTKVSPGCANCYAERLFPKVYGKDLVTVVPVGQGRDPDPARDEGFRRRVFADVRIYPDRLDQPLRWRKPIKIFVCSMGDLFHEEVPDDFIDRVLAVARVSPRHTFQILTKRPERMLQYMTTGQHGDRRDDIAASAFDLWGDKEDRNGLLLFSDNEMMIQSEQWPLSNVWLGVSVEDQKRADERIPLLLETPAAVRFLSCEPLLGPIDLKPWIKLCRGDLVTDEEGRYSEVRHDAANKMGVFKHREAWALLWVISGGESGPRARPMPPAWVRSLRDQCQAAGVPYFFKQWGEWAPDCFHSISKSRICKTIKRPPPCSPHSVMFRCGKKIAGRQLDGRTWNEMPA